jgi:hypothetical protein
MALLKGIRIVDKNEGEEILKFHSNWLTFQFQVKIF